MATDKHGLNQLHLDVSLMLIQVFSCLQQLARDRIFRVTNDVSP